LTAATVGDRDFSLSAAGWREWFGATGRADLNLLLLVLWDPIGIRGTEVAAGEYENYVSGVLPYVARDDPAGLADHLLAIATDAMGLPPSEPPLLAAETIVDGAYASAWMWAGRPLPGDPR
jgi:hypothetical protein